MAENAPAPAPSPASPSEVTAAMRFNADMKRKYDALVTAEKPPKLALTAIMRKLIILANALIRDNRQWSEVRP